MSLGAAFAGFAQGAAQGYGIRRQMDRDEEDKKDRAEERIRRKQEQEWREQEQKHIRDQRELDERLLRGLTSVRRTDDSWGSGYDWARQNSAPVRDDDGNLMPGVVSAPRAQEAILRDRAAAAAAVPSLRGASLAAEYETAANAEADRLRGIARQDRIDANTAEDRRIAEEERARRKQIEDMAKRQLDAQEAMRSARILFQAGNLDGALAAVGKAYSFYPDGRELVKNGNLFGLATVGPDGKPVAASSMLPITRDNVSRAIEMGMQVYDPNIWAKLREVERGDEDSAALRGLRGAQKRYYDSGGSRPDAAAKQTPWERVEVELIRQGASPTEIARQKEAFEARRGTAPAAAVAVLKSGKKPDGKTPLTRADVDEFNKRYPNSKVDPKTLPWLQGAK